MSISKEFVFPEVKEDLVSHLHLRRLQPSSRTVTETLGYLA